MRMRKEGFQVSYVFQGLYWKGSQRIPFGILFLCFSNSIGKKKGKRVSVFLFFPTLSSLSISKRMDMDGEVHRPSPFFFGSLFIVLVLNKSCRTKASIPFSSMDSFLSLSYTMEKNLDPKGFHDE